jgi:hypothetical protein
MTKTELESKHLADLHSLAAEAGVERYRMLTRAELIDKLADGDSGNGGSGHAGGGSSSERGERPARRRRSGSRESSGERKSSGGGRESSGQRKSSGGGRDSGGRDSGGGRESGGRERSRRRDSSSRDRDPASRGRTPRAPREREHEPEAPEPSPPAPEPAAPPPAAAEPSSRPRRRRRRRFGRRGKSEVTLQGLLLPPEAGRQAVLCAETRAACTALLRGIAADLSAEAKGGPDPVALLIDPSPEELAEWRRDAPQAEIVAAGQPRHASDALAQAVARAGRGDDVILLVDSLTRLAEAHEDAEAAKEFFDAGRVQGSAGGGSLTVVAALERSA